VSVAESNQEGAHVTRFTSAPSALRPPATAEVLRQLEFARALDAVAGRAVGPLGAASVRGRLPSADATWLAGELATLAELQRLLIGGDGFRPEPIADLTPLLDQLEVPGTVLDGAALLELGRGLDAMRVVAAELKRVTEDAPRVGALRADVPPPALARDILQTFEPDGRVRDGADPGVDRARTHVREARARLIQLLERTLRGLAAHEASPDASVTVRDGRYVIPVARDARGRVPGIVHAESASGATLFIEPQGAVELGNALSAAEAAESRAVLALLRRLTDAARPHVTAAAAGLAMCVAADDLYARARYAADVQAAVPALGAAPGPHVLRGARHPLLLAEGVAAVPFDLELETGELALVVSGPNTGGKTVLLKAVGLMSALVQAGVVPPLGDGSALPVYETITSDIGDNQSIAASLSTFSAHLHALRDALTQAGPAVLVLLDEIGSGTDPIEGAALAAATLQTLVARGSRVVATTHLSDLKQLAAETPGIVNASLQFDAATLTPTYRLVKGIPGRSYGLVIARRLGLPPDVLDLAEGRTPEAERSLDAILADVERRAAVVGERETELDALAAQLGRREGQLARLRDELEQRERVAATRAAELEREGREQARHFLLEARKRVEQALGAARAAVTEAAAHEARRLVEQQISEEADALKQLEDQLARKGWRVKGGPTPAAAAAGNTVRVVHRGRIKATPSGPEAAAPAPRSPAATAVSEVDLRGMTADEAAEAVDRALDAATLADIPVLRIIHGKGTGVLRQVVDQRLRGDRRVAVHRLAPPREGGTGVTIAELA
jgi:DNA mismatch repair protein MutS2